MRLARAVFVAALAVPAFLPHATGCAGTDSGSEAAGSNDPTTTGGFSSTGGAGGAKAGNTSTGGTAGKAGGNATSGAAGSSAGTAGASAGTGGQVSGGGGGQGGGSGLMCPPKSLPNLQMCAGAKSPCVQCLCGACEQTWVDCVNDKGCSDAVACSATGCSLNACATLASGDSLGKAFAVKACSDASCQSLCQTTGTGGAAGAAGAAGGSGTSGTSGGAGKAGSSGTAGSAGSTAGGGGAAGKSGASGASGAAGKAGSAGTAGAAGKSGASGAGGSTMTCDPACASDEKCNPASGLCGECLTKADCADSGYGLACLGTSSFPLTCGCAFSSDCLGHPGGGTCDGFNNVCTCASTQDCGSSPWGKACVDVKLENGVNTTQCGCVGDGDCPMGKKCQGLLSACF